MEDFYQVYPFRDIVNPYDVRPVHDGRRVGGQGARKPPGGVPAGNIAYKSFAGEPYQ
jgi:hypothetical protein